MAKLFYGFLFATAFLFDGYLTIPQVNLQFPVRLEEPKPKPKPQAPIYQLASILTSFKKAELCGHICTALTWFDKEGRVHARFTTPLNPGEISDDLCKCMYDYINPDNYLLDVTHKCCVDYTTSNTFTMTLDGPPNPNKDGTVVAAEPVAALAAILKRYPEADLGQHKCTSSSTVDKDGLTHLVLLCELTCDSPPPKDVCTNIIKYLNQNNWLGKITTKCSDKRYDLTVEIIGK